MDFEDIERILELVRQHDLGGIRGRKRRVEAPGPQGLGGVRRCRPPCRMAAAAAADAPAAAAAAGACPPAPAPRGPDGRRRPLELAVVKSPIVGTFYRSPEPGAASFVEIGERVKKDQVLCIIEAMKLMNEITSEYDGEIVSVYVENGKPVQYGERLFAIKTRRDGPGRPCSRKSSSPTAAKSRCG